MESRFQTALRNSIPVEELTQATAGSDPRQGSWSQTDLLLALVIDLLGQANTIAVQAAGGDAEMPEPLPRPGVPQSKAERRGRDETPDEKQARRARMQAMYDATSTRPQS